MLAEALLLAVLLTGSGAAAENNRPPAPGASFTVAVPAHDYDLLLGRPENNSIALSVLAYRDSEGYVSYGSEPGTYTSRTFVHTLRTGEPAEIVLKDLQPDTVYYYQFHWRPSGTQPFASSSEYTFHTARRPGATFTFTMTADAHLDEHTSPDVYLQTLTNIRSDMPDFHIDLGNLFMTDKHASRNEAAAQYLAQRYYLGQIGPSVPILLALGTHDGEASRYDDGSPECLATWSNLMRKRYFPNPVPDEFYTGNKASDPHTGPLQNYYAWQWGDALFIVLDPFRNSLRVRGSSDGWAWSLGQTQYEWLEKTLESSHARLKFVIIHNLLSGDQASRGGVEIAPYNEWGGKNPDGSEGFNQHRPGWNLPVHQLLVRHQATAVFRAHDNFYARQELDGIVYLMVPQPSFAGNDRIRDLENYGYRKGIFLGNSGHVRVTVSPNQVTTEYVRCQLPQDQRKQENAQVSDRCTITLNSEGAKPFTRGQ